MCASAPETPCIIIDLRCSMHRFYSIRLSPSEFDIHLTSYEKLKLRVGTAGGDGPRVVTAYDDHIVGYNELVAMSDLADHPTLYCCARLRTTV